ncbi:MAG: hypothetical protein IIY02_02885, partial [Firmicutes bacterium]|nr:hypothetical protein [Bacillota bacterium]
GTIPYGTKVHVEATYNGWGEVVYKGEYGWIALKYTVNAEDFVEVKDGTVEDDGVVEDVAPAEDVPAVTSLEKEDSGSNVLPIILIGMIILVIVIAAVLIIVIIARKK